MGSKLLDLDDDLMQSSSIPRKGLTKEVLIVQKPIRHPSWRIYKALRDCGLSLQDYGLKDINVDYMYSYDDELTIDLKKILTHKNDDPDIEDVFGIQVCLDVFNDIYDRQLLEGLLLAGKGIDEICDIVECEDDFVITYKTLFFDTSVFRNNVDKLSYVRRGTQGDDALSKQEIISKGAEYLKVKYGVDANKLSMASILTDSFAKAYLKMLSLADQEDLGSQEMAQGWLNTMIKIAAELGKDKSGNASIGDLIVQLKTTPAPTKGFDDLDI